MLEPPPINWFTCCAFILKEGCSSAEFCQDIALKDVYLAVADPDIRNIRKCECQIFDRQNLSCEILRNHEKVDRIMHLVAKLSDFCLFHPGFFSFFYNRFYLSSHLCEADSLSTSEALIGILAILNVYGSVTERLRSSSASCECSPQCLPQKAY